jgi:hypothetical protein
MVYLGDDSTQEAIGIGNVLIQLNSRLKTEVWDVFACAKIVENFIIGGKINPKWLKVLLRG